MKRTELSAIVLELLKKETGESYPIFDSMESTRLAPCSTCSKLKLMPRRSDKPPDRYPMSMGEKRSTKNPRQKTCLRRAKLRTCVA